MGEEVKASELGSDMETSCEVCGCTAPCGDFDDKDSGKKLHLCLGCAIELGFKEEQ